MEDWGSWRMGGRGRRRGTDKTQILIDDIYFHNLFSRYETANLYADLFLKVLGLFKPFGGSETRFTGIITPSDITR